MLDMFLHAEKNPEIVSVSNAITIPLGSKIAIPQTDIHLGGCAVNVTIGLSRLGVTPVLTAETGDDALSNSALDMLKKENIDCSHVVITPGAKASFAVVLDMTGERTEFVHQEVREHNLPIDDVTAPWVYLASVGNTWQELYTRVLTHSDQTHAKIIFNPGSMQLHAGLEALLPVLAKTEVLLVNNEEAAGLVGKGVDSDLHAIMDELHAKGPRIVVVTQGEKGATVRDDSGQYFFQESLPTSFVEKTGAGDAFSSGFTAAYIQGKTLQEALLWGSANAASVIAHGGGQQGLMDPSQLEMSLRERNIA